MIVSFADSIFVTIFAANQKFKHLDIQILDFSSDRNMLLFVFSVLTLTITYSLYWFLTHNIKFLRAIGGGKSSAGQWTARRLTGFVLMGVIPAILVYTFDLISFSELGFNNSWDNEGWYWVLGVGAVTLLVSLGVAKKPVNLKSYPQIRESNWTTLTMVQEYGGWFLYLVGYEFLFRGLFLFGTIPVLGYTGAIAVNICAYSLAHMVKGWQETFGAIILGFIYAYVTIITGSLWFALFMHVFQAWSNSFFSFRNQEDMRYVS